MKAELNTPNTHFVTTSSSYISNLMCLLSTETMSLIENNLLVWHWYEVLAAVFNHKHNIVLYFVTEQITL